MYDDNITHINTEDCVCISVDGYCLRSVETSCHTQSYIGPYCIRYICIQRIQTKQVGWLNQHCLYFGVLLLI